MRRWLVPGAFAALAVPMGARAAGALIDALAQLDARAGLVALYFVLRLGVGIAFAVFTLRRPEPRRRSREPLALATCAMAMLVVLPVGGPGRGTATGLVLAGDVVAVVACTWLLISVLALGRCFGVLPEARGLVTRGPYRLVRHPIYLGEIGALSGLTLSSPHAWTVAFLVLFCATQLVRMRLEERALTAAFPEYGWYAARTRRLLPRLRTSSASNL
jgi:protein-S-isoprenylcysteine O-methyltransferase Ste14